MEEWVLARFLQQFGDDLGQTRKVEKRTTFHIRNIPSHFLKCPGIHSKHVYGAQAVFSSNQAFTQNAVGTQWERRTQPAAKPYVPLGRFLLLSCRFLLLSCRFLLLSCRFVSIALL